MELLLVLLTTLLLLRCGTIDASASGYAVSFVGSGQMMSTRSLYLDGTDDAEISKLAAGFTVAFWVKFNDLTPSRNQANMDMNHLEDGTFFAGTGGVLGGYQFSSGAPRVVSSLGEAAVDWHHYAFSWDTATNVRKTYLDGALFQEDQLSYAKTNWLDYQPHLHFGYHCYPENYYAATTADCNGAFSFDGTMDDIAFWGGALTEEEVALRWDASLSRRVASGDEPDLLLFYDFNDPSASSSGVEPNLGSAGSAYDLLLGLIKDDGFGASYLDGGVSYPFRAPTLVPSHIPPKAEADPDAPIVLEAAAGETVSYDGVPAVSHEAPAEAWNETIVLSVDGATVHVVHADTPRVDATLATTLLEDAAVAIQLWGTTSSASRLVPVISRPPSKGMLYEIAHGDDVNSRTTPIVAEGQAITSLGGWVAYVPPLDGAGEPYESFGYKMRLEEWPTHESAEATVVVSVKEMNDLPTVSGATFELVEDMHAEGVHVNVSAYDPEEGHLLELYVATLPTKGQLYRVDDNTGTTELIESEYNLFDVGTGLLIQYLDEVQRVSSFWGGPPYAGYHPLTITGPPDCKDTGVISECPTDHPWVFDLEAWPDLGTRCLYEGLLAYVHATHPDNGTLTLRYAPMFKPVDADADPPTFQQCHIDPASAKQYPADCSFDDVPADGVITVVVPRGAIGPQEGGGWCPLNKAYASATGT